MSQLADANDDFARMVRIAIAHLERGKQSAPNAWAMNMIDNCIFNAKRVLEEQP